MIEIQKYPRCQKYLKAANVNLNETAMNEYWAALCVAESFSEKALQKFGGINFHTMTGDKLLARMEQFLEFRSKAMPKRSKFVPTNPLDKITSAISAKDIIAAMTPKGAWKRETLDQWGVPWPPPKGWRKRLTDNFSKSNS